MMKKLQKIDKRSKKLIKLEQLFFQFHKIFAERFCSKLFLACFRQLYMNESESEYCL